MPEQRMELAAAARIIRAHVRRTLGPGWSVRIERWQSCGGGAVVKLRNRAAPDRQVREALALARYSDPDPGVSLFTPRVNGIVIYSGEAIEIAQELRHVGGSHG